MLGLIGAARIFTVGVTLNISRILRKIDLAERFVQKKFDFTYCNFPHSKLRHGYLSDYHRLVFMDRTLSM